MTKLSGGFADLTIVAVFDGLGPATPAFARVVGGKFGNYPLDGFDGEITVEGTELRCVLTPKPNFTGSRPRGVSLQEHAVVTFGLSVQPDRLFSELREHDAFFDSGFAWRFLFALVRSTLGEPTHRTPSTPEDVRNEYNEGLRRMLNLPLPAGLDFPVLHLEQDATETLLQWEAGALEPRLKPTGDLAGLESWASKLPSRLCRIAALFHCAEHPTDPWNRSLTVATMERALRLAPYFIAHAKAVAAELNADENLRRARRAVEWLRRERRAQFKRRDLHKAIANNEGAEVLDRPLRILEDRGFIRAATKEPGRTGRPSAEFVVNPLVFKGR